MQKICTLPDDVRVSVIGIGCGRVASISNPVPMREIEATLEAGINLFDTADIYGQGDSERTLSRLLRRDRDRMFVDQNWRSSWPTRRANPITLQS